MIKAKKIVLGVQKVLCAGIKINSYNPQSAIKNWEKSRIFRFSCLVFRRGGGGRATPPSPHTEVTSVRKYPNNKNKTGVVKGGKGGL